MAIQKNDFVELEFTGFANGNVFDTTDKEKAKLAKIEADVRPIIVSVGNKMLLDAFDEDLSGKEIGKVYKIHLLPEFAFGKRDPTLIKVIPMKLFREKEIYPAPGMTFQMDNYLVKILSVSGGRVTGDFNYPLAGKEIDYEYKILRKVDDKKEQVNAIQEFFFRKKFDFELKDNQAIFKDPKITPLVDIFKDKFKELTGLDFVVEKKIEKIEKTEKAEKIENQENKEEKPTEETEKEN
jgi:FKBP-type peptidyl-prolyl cis-trans isomerase 2